MKGYVDRQLNRDLMSSTSPLAWGNRVPFLAPLIVTGLNIAIGITVPGWVGTFGATLILTACIPGMGMSEPRA